MRVKKQKQVRRHVRFFKACCGFREPFKVLCDGNFVHAALTARMGGLQELLPNFLGASAKAFVTRCVIAELKSLGDDYTGTVMAARRLDIAKCNHDPLLSAADCVEGMVGKNNTEHFLVATQDVELRRKLRKVPGGALLFAQNTGLIMEPPSSQQILYARLSEEERLHMAKREQKVIEQRAKQKAEKTALAASNVSDAKGTPDQSDVTDLPQSNQRVSKLKRKRAKGPNPLSRRKKKIDPAKTKTTNQVVVTSERAGDVAVTKTKRQRHRLRRKSTSEEQPASE